MLIEFTLDDNALQANTDPMWKQRHQHLEFTKFWERNGILILQNKIEKTSIPKLARRLPNGVRKFWLDALVEMRKTPDRYKYAIRDDLPERQISSLENIADYNDFLELFFIGDNTASNIGYSGPFSQSEDGAELGAYTTFDSTRKISSLRVKESRRVTSNETPDDVWETRFLKLCQNSSEINIVDRYSLLNFQNGQNNSGLAKFLEFLQQTTLKHPVSLCLYSNNTCNNPLDIQRDLISISHTNINRFQVILADDSSFRNLCHDRFFSFDKRVLDVTIGLEILEANKRDSNCSYRIDNNGDYKKTMDDLDRESVGNLTII